MTEPITTEPIKDENDSRWAKFISKHRAIFAVFITAAVLAAIGAIYVFVWFTANAQSTGLVPSALSGWSIGNIMWFLIYTIIWELTLIGVPVAIGAVIGWQWWKRLPEEEKRQYQSSGKRSHSSRAGGVISPLLFIAFALKVYVDGNWNAAIASWTLDYVVGSMVTILVWIAAIFAIPAIIGLTWWLTSGRNKKP